MTRDTLTKIREARAVSTPLIAVATADPYAAAEALSAEYDPTKNPKQTAANVPPIIGWDNVRGYFPINEKGQLAITKGIQDARGNMQPPMLPPKQDDFGLDAVRPDVNPIEALTIAYSRAPEGAFLLFWNAHFLMEAPQALQGLCNLRDPFKGNRRTAILFAPSWRLPAELSQDTMTIDDPLPSIEELQQLTRDEIENFATSKAAGADWPKPSTELIDRAGAAMQGLARFPAEQSIALSLRNHKTINLELLSGRRDAYVSQTKGLIVEKTRETLADVQGLDAIVDQLRATCEGREAPALIVRLEELEKQLAGARGDNTGVSQDLLSTILTAMEDYEWSGLIAFGVPGAGKSLLSRALAKTYELPCITMDIGAIKGSLVGQTEQAARACMKTLRAIGGNRVYFLASSNGMATIPAPLRRRFTDGIWFFDFMGTAALAPVWDYYRAKYEIPADDPTPDHGNWTPAEIRNCCRAAYRLRRPLADCAKRIVPVAIADQKGIRDMRELAHGSFLDATSGGIYQNPGDGATTTQTGTKARMYD